MAEQEKHSTKQQINPSCYNPALVFGAEELHCINPDFIRTNHISEIIVRSQHVSNLAEANFISTLSYNENGQLTTADWGYGNFVNTYENGLLLSRSHGPKDSIAYLYKNGILQHRTIKINEETKEVFIATKNKITYELTQTHQENSSETSNNLKVFTNAVLTEETVHNIIQTALSLELLFDSTIINGKHLLSEDIYIQQLIKGQKINEIRANTKDFSTNETYTATYNEQGLLVKMIFSWTENPSHNTIRTFTYCQHGLEEILSKTRFRTFLHQFHYEDDKLTKITLSQKDKDLKDFEVIEVVTFSYK